MPRVFDHASEREHGALRSRITRHTQRRKSFMDMGNFPGRTAIVAGEDRLLRMIVEISPNASLISNMLSGMSTRIIRRASMSFCSSIHLAIWVEVFFEPCCSMADQVSMGLRTGAHEGDHFCQFMECGGAQRGKNNAVFLRSISGGDAAHARDGKHAHAVSPRQGEFFKGRQRIEECFGDCACAQGLFCGRRHRRPRPIRQANLYAKLRRPLRPRCGPLS